MLYCVKICQEFFLDILIARNPGQTDRQTRRYTNRQIDRQTKWLHALHLQLWRGTCNRLNFHDSKRYVRSHQCLSETVLITCPCSYYPPEIFPPACVFSLFPPTPVPTGKLYTCQARYCDLALQRDLLLCISAVQRVYNKFFSFNIALLFFCQVKLLSAISIEQSSKKGDIVWQVLCKNVPFARKDISVNLRLFQVCSLPAGLGSPYVVCTDQVLFDKT